MKLYTTEESRINVHIYRRQETRLSVQEHQAYKSRFNYGVNCYVLLSFGSLPVICTVIPHTCTHVFEYYFFLELQKGEFILKTSLLILLVQRKY